MKCSLLYLSVNPRMSLMEKVAEGCMWFVKKYGRMPEICVVHPDDVSKLEITPPNKITVNKHPMIVLPWTELPNKWITMDCVWLGLEGLADEPQPVPQKPNSDAVSAFIKHVQQVRREEPS